MKRRMTALCMATLLVLSATGPVFGAEIDTETGVLPDVQQETAFQSEIAEDTGSPVMEVPSGETESMQENPVVQEEESSPEEIFGDGSSGEIPAVENEADALLPEEEEEAEEGDMFSDTEKVYTYTVTPILAPFNEYFFVKTDDPDPTTLIFEDRESVLLDAGSTIDYLRATKDRYLDVVYENRETGRVNGGYIFESQRTYEYDTSDVDGGELTLLRFNGKEYVDTGIRVECPRVTDYVQYLIDTCAVPGDLFGSLDAIESFLNDMAVYPYRVVDVNLKNEDWPFPSLAVSPYPELTLNTHIDVYQTSQDQMLLKAAFPYVLDSLGFPGAISQAAKRMEPSCTYERGDVHYNIVVTWNGVSRTYGGAGDGGYDPLYNTHVEPLFRFDGSAEDFATAGTLGRFRDKYMEYGKIAIEDAQYYLDLVQGDTFKETMGNGGWIRVGSEGATELSYAYVTPGYDYEFHLMNAQENAWVDGRYVNQYNRFEKGATFEKYPTSNIIVQNVTYSTFYGEVRHGDLTYTYQADQDCWVFHNNILAEDLVLTRAEVEAMDVDRNTDIVPEGRSYDGSVFPGTPYKPCPPHNMKTYVVAEATCTSDGYQYERCLYCDYKGEEKTIPATGHSYGEYIVVEKPTVLKEGEMERTCTTCGHKETQSIDKLKPTITLSATSLTLVPGESETVQVSGLAEGDSVMKWKSNNPRILSVSGDGTIKALKAGKGTVTVTLKSGLKTKVTVTVEKTTIETEEIRGIPAKLTMRKGEKTTLKPVLVPSSSQEKVTFKSSRRRIVAVSSDGTVTARKKGKATITVTSGRVKVKCRVVVK